MMLIATGKSHNRTIISDIVYMRHLLVFGPGQGLILWPYWYYRGKSFLSCYDYSVLVNPDKYLASKINIVNSVVRTSLE